ncbi:MAG: MBL fold metallo-hydrolase [Planctomycetia bacterium]|nr:MBL fold metallo-hydrolase [Planctomycetia bacterium]
MDSPPRLRIAAIVSRPFDENTYVAHLEGRDDCVVIDPGLEPGKISDYLGRESLTPAAIVCTHGHADHIGGNAALKKRWPDCPLVIGRGDEPMLADPMLNFSKPFGAPLVSPPADGVLSEGDVYCAAGLELWVYEIPGHSPGHVVLVYKGQSPFIVFGGDVLFASRRRWGRRSGVIRTSGANDTRCSGWLQSSGESRCSSSRAKSSSRSSSDAIECSRMRRRPIPVGGWKYFRTSSIASTTVGWSANFLPNCCT